MLTVRSRTHDRADVR